MAMLNIQRLSVFDYMQYRQRDVLHTFETEMELRIWAFFLFASL